MILQMRICDDMKATELHLRNEIDAETFAQELAAFTRRMEENLARFLQCEPGVEPTPAEVLYHRAVKDLAALQNHLSMLPKQLASRDAFVDLLRKKGSEREKALLHVELIGQLDRALECLVNLMQYDETNRTEIDTRNGFHIACGSVNYGRMHFAQEPKKEDD